MCCRRLSPRYLPNAHISINCNKVIMNREIERRKKIYGIPRQLGDSCLAIDCHQYSRSVNYLHKAKMYSEKKKCVACLLYGAMYVIETPAHTYSYLNNVKPHCVDRDKTTNGSEQHRAAHRETSCAANQLNLIFRKSKKKTACSASTSTAAAAAVVQAAATAVTQIGALSLGKYQKCGGKRNAV